MKEQIINIIKENTKSQFEIYDVSTLNSLNISSIDFVRIVVDIENKFSIEFDDIKLQHQEFPTVQSLIDYVEGKVKQKNEC